MASGEYLDVQLSERRQHVYRIVSVNRLYDLFEERRNGLVDPRRWEDPFENFILKSQRLSRHGWFGQCWTRHRASDAMWRIYSNEKKGVRIRSTPQALLRSLTRAERRSEAFIGRVRYFSEAALVRFTKDALRPGHLAARRNAARTLLVKRWAFQHEREIRLIAWANERPPDGVLTYDVNPHELIDQLMLDPRLSIDEAETLKAEIKARTGFGGPIKRSLLYAPPAWLNVLDTPSNTRLQPTARRSVLRRG